MRAIKTGPNKSGDLTNYSYAFNVKTAIILFFIRTGSIPMSGLRVIYLREEEARHHSLAKPMSLLTLMEGE